MSRNSPTTRQFENVVSVLSTGLALGSEERITMKQNASSPSVSRLGGYALLDRGEISAIRLGRRWIVTRHATSSETGTLGPKPGAGSE
jgi:hypothetical protein